MDGENPKLIDWRCLRLVYWVREKR